MHARIECPGALSDDRAGDRHHLGVEIALRAAELCRPNPVGRAQCEERHARSPRLDHHHPLAPAERKTTNADNTGLGHSSGDHPQRLDRDRAIGVEVIRTVEINGIDLAARYEPLQIDHLLALDIKRLQLLG